MFVLFSVTVPEPDFFRKFGLKVFVHFGFVPSVILPAMVRVPLSAPNST